MIRICAWCRKQIGRNPPALDDKITYEVCCLCGSMLRKKYRLIYPAALDDGEAKKNVLVITTPP
jgi:hypothetical protein